ncbi:iap2 [Catopsilia pomona nucleopolyhedrovirus]|uniref:Iap2 n=1 Tax=Catopsilia pomona nucleopolyhedrovirus TaxID=1850906 RepID=A0A172WZE1_9ABAC|nr:iap2 [Catopsilia pomona nucleopolyhedrovirus]ANF29719.1 iap2 [Catopsilia pomona nucleopolyhedrovirus]
MDLRQFNFLILSTDGRYQTMANMMLDNDTKLDLAKTGLFCHNNLIKCIGCYTTMDKIDVKLVKRHTYSDNCISSTNLLMLNETMRKRSFVSFKSARRQFKSQLIIDMLARRGFYTFGKPSHLRCSGCRIIIKYTTIDDAQKQHKQNCRFIHVFDDHLTTINICNDINKPFNAVNNNSDNDNDIDDRQILTSDLPPPETNGKIVVANNIAVVAAAVSEPSAPCLSELLTHDQQTAAVECKICFDREKSVCFMPCRHLAVCVECSRRCKKCCVCNAKILQRIETLPQ